MTLSVLGCRGSVPVSGEEYREFGWATSCYLVETEKQAIFLDAGTGIVNAPNLGKRAVSVLLSHPHLDHIQGLPFFPVLSERGREIGIYAARGWGDRAGSEEAAKDSGEAGGDAPARGIDTVLGAVLGRPFWPVTIHEYPANVTITDADFPLQLGEVRVSAMEGNHPGGSTIFRLGAEGKSIVYATDFEHTEEKIAELADFAQGTDLLLYDGQYTNAEYASRRGFGHSTLEMGLRVFRESGAKRIQYVHHDPKHSDDMLRRIESGLPPEASLAREGERIEI